MSYPSIWTEAMDEVMRTDYPRYGARYVARALCLNVSQVMHRAGRMNIRSPKNHTHLLEDCEAMLAEFCSEPMSAIAKRRGLTRSQVQACIARARKR